MAIGSASAEGVAGTIRVEAYSGVAIETDVRRAPFSEAEMAERFAADPAFYRSIAALAASELRRRAAVVEHQTNSGQVIRSQLTELAEGFEGIANVLTVSDGILTAKAAREAATAVTKIREAFAAFCEGHPELIQLAVIGLAGYVLHQFGGVQADIGLLVSYAVIRRERLSDIFSGKKEE